MSIPLAKGTPVISLADGSKLGTIDHVYFDPAGKSVVGFTFHQGGGLFGRGSSGLVEITDVHAFGANAVTITDVSTVRSELVVERYKDTLLDLEELLHRTVMTESGVQIGRVRAIQFGDASYQLSGLEVDAADTHQPVRISADRIQTIGAEFIIIAVVESAASSKAGDRQPLRVISSHPASPTADAPTESRPA